MDFDLSFMFTAIKACLTYIPETLLLSVSAFIIGIIFGLFIAIARIFQVKFFAKALKVIVDVLKAIPMVLILYLLFFSLTDIYAKIDSLIIGIIGLSIFSSVIISETIRGAFMSISNGQYEASYSVGLTIPQTFKRIIIPQVIPVAAPVLCNNLIGLVKASSIMYLIAIKDILNAALTVASSSYRFLEAYVAAALVYWAICLVIERISKILEKYMGRFRRIVA